MTVIEHLLDEPSPPPHTTEKNTPISSTDSKKPAASDISSDDSHHQQDTTEKEEDSRIGACEIVQNEGKELFLAKNYAEAKKKYERLLQFVGMMFKARDGEAQLGEPFRLKAHLNMALCDLKMKQYGDCLEHCREALKLEPDSLKAHLRMAKAYQETGQIHSAETAYKKCLSIDENLAEARKGLKELKNEDKKTLQQQKKVFKNWTEKTSLYNDKKDVVRKEDKEKEEAVANIGKEWENRLGINVWRAVFWENWLFWVMLGGLALSLMGVYVYDRITASFAS